MARKRPTHCPHGHEYTEENRYIRPDNGKLECRECRKESRAAPPETKTISTGNKIYTEEDILVGLTALASHDGVARRAARDTGISTSTLQRWRRDHTDRYLEIQEELVPKVRARVAERSLEIAGQASEAEEEALAKLRQELPKLEGRDLANALRNISTTKGISLTHANNFQAAVQKADEGMSADDVISIMDKLVRMGVVSKRVEAEQEPAIEAEVVSEDT